MITEVSAVSFRQNLGDMLNQVQYRNDSTVINKDGKAAAALIDAELLSKIRWTVAEIRDLVDSFLFLADIVEPEPGADAELRDAADQPVLATWKAARAQYLITGDKDLLALSGRFPIITPAAFWERHGG